MSDSTTRTKRTKPNASTIAAKIAAERKRLGFVVGVQPYGDTFRHRLLATIDDDPEFRQAMAARLGVN